MEKGSFIGLDVGDKRIGVAASDPEGILAFAVSTIHRRGLQHDLKEIRALIEEYKPPLIVVGLPRTMKGELGEQARKVMSFAEHIKNNLQIPIEYCDERLTTVNANRLMMEAGLKSKARREKIDSASAVLILQAYLDDRPRTVDEKP